MKRLRIGIFPLSLDFKHPGDRRRFAAWAMNRKHELVIGELKNIDMLFLTEGSDFFSIHKKTSAPKILDLVDGYLGEQNPLQDFSRGTAHSIVRKYFTYPRTYSSIVRDTCRNVDLVVCSSPEQQKTIRPYNDNVKVILDDHSEIPLMPFTSLKNKNDARNSRGLWEGTPHTLNGLENLVRNCEGAIDGINVVTDLHYFRVMNRFFGGRTKTRLQKRFGMTAFNLFSWNIANLKSARLQSTHAVLPVDKSSYIQYLKPENRLLIMFRLGLPCISTDLLSYKRVEQKLNVPLTASTWSEWRQMIELIKSDQEFAAYQVSLGQQYIKEYHTQELLFSAWDAAVESIL